MEFKTRRHLLDRKHIKTMKRTKLIFNLSLFGMLALVLCYQIVYSKQKSKELAIDLPEEIILVSKIQNKPDTLVSFIKNDTLFIGFSHKN